MIPQQEKVIYVKKCGFYVKNVQKWQKTAFFHRTFMVSHNFFPSIKTTMLKVYIQDNGSPK